MTAPVDTPDAPVAAPDAHGLDPDGRPYEADPGPLRGILRRNTNGRRPRGGTQARKTAPKKAAPKKAPAKAAPAKEAELTPGGRVRSWVSLGSALLTNKAPVESALLRGYGDAIAPVIDRWNDQDARVGRWIEKFDFLSLGGPGSEAAMVTATYGAAMAVHRGFRHPALVAISASALMPALVEAAVRQYHREAAGAVEDIPSGLSPDLLLSMGVPEDGFARVREIFAELAAPPAPAGPPVVDVDQAVTTDA